MTYKAWHDGVFSSVRLDTAPSVIVTVVPSSPRVAPATQDFPVTHGDIDTGLPTA